MDKETKEILSNVILAMDKLRRMVDMDYYDVASYHRAANADLEMELGNLYKIVRNIEEEK